MRVLTSYVEGTNGFLYKYAREVTYATLITPIAIEALLSLRRHWHQIHQLPQNIKRFYVSHFFPREEESEREAGMRIWKNVGNARLGCLAITTLVVTAYSLISLGVIQKGVNTLYLWLQGTRIGKAVSRRLEPPRVWQSPIPEPAPLVYTGYTLLGLIYLVRSKRSWKQSPFYCSFHALNALVATATPFVMLSGRYPVRWHHLSYGLLCNLPHLPALNFFGTCMVVDSLGYWFDSNKDSSYDFANIFVENMGSYLFQLTFLSLWHVISKRMSHEDSSPRRDPAAQPLLAENAIDEEELDTPV